MSETEGLGHPAAQAGKRGAGPVLRAPRVLLVDDQQARLLAYEAILGTLDVVCVRALSGEEALGRLMQDEYAVILLDVNMPGMSGYEVAGLVRAHPRFERMPIIFVTAVYVTEFDRLKGYEVGAIDYISVPVVPEILRAKVAVLVELYQRRRELQETNRELREARAELDAQHARALSEAEAQLRIVFEHPTELAFVLEAIDDGSGAAAEWVIRNANINALNLLGKSRGAVIGRSVREVMPGEAERVATLCAQVSVSQEMVRYETHVGGRDFLVTLYPMGRHAVISSSLDVTERKRTIAALRASERRYRALVEAAPVAVAHNALNGRFEFANQAFCRLVGYSEEELKQRTWQDITHPDDLAGDQSFADRVRSREIPHYTMQKRYVRKDGSTVWVELFGNIVFDDDGRPELGVAVVVDITPHKRAAEALRESEQRLRQVADNVDQFVWTCDELGNGTWYNARWFEYTGMTLEETAGDGWKKTVHPEHLDRVTAHVAQCVHAGVPWEDTFPLRGKDGQYRWFLSRAMPVRDASGRIVQWFGTNTDVTALRALQESLQQADRRKDEFLAVVAHELRNPVAPIRTAAEALAHELPDRPSARELLSIIRRQAGYLSRLLDDLLDVAGTARSAPAPLTSEFSQVDGLPPAQDAQMQTAAPADDVQPGRSVLIVDDNRDAADSLAALLNLLGHRGHAVYSGEAALEKVAALRPDVVILDIGLPDRDGYAVARRIRASHDPAVLVVALTGYGSALDRQRASEAGFDLHFVKPVDPVGLIRAITTPRPPR